MIATHFYRKLGKFVVLVYATTILPVPNFDARGLCMVNSKLGHLFENASDIRCCRVLIVCLIFYTGCFGPYRLVERYSTVSSRTKFG